MLRSLLVAFVLLLGAPFVAAQPAGGTLPVDPVELIEGRDTAGEQTIFVDRGHYRYVFINEANKARFLGAPETYEIQMGGACARMGPLSGRGRPDLYTAHNGHIYIFASEGCKATFLKNADRMVEADDPKLSFDADSEARAIALVEKAIAAHGGERVDAVTNTVAYSESEQKTNAGPAKLTSTTTVAFGKAIHKRDTWDEHVWGWVATHADSFTYSASGDEPLATTQVRALGRLAAVNPIAILRARNRPDFVAGHLGAGAIGDTPVERVAIWFNGFGPTLSIDPASGRILAITFKDRGPSMMIGEVERRYADFQESAGVTLPQRMDTFFDGKPWPEQSGPVQWTADAPLNEAEWVREKAG